MVKEYREYNFKDVVITRWFDIPIYAFACYGIVDYIGWWVSIVFFIVFLSISFSRSENQRNSENIEVLHDELKKLKDEVRIYREQIME